jgi:hypothetical protein
MVFVSAAGQGKTLKKAENQSADGPEARAHP